MNINFQENALYGGSAQPDGTLILMGKNNWFLHIDPSDPNKSEWFTTTVSGDPFAPRKLFQVRMHDGPPYPQPIVEEVDLKDDKTVGVIEPLVCTTPAGTYVAVRNAQRHNGIVVEAFRKSWSNPAEAPNLLTNGGVIKNYSDRDLGRGLSNDARITAVLRLAQIKYALTVVEGANNLPKISEGYWMEIETFLLTTLEHMGKGVVLLGAYVGHIPQANRAKLAQQIAALPELITKLSE